MAVPLKIVATCCAPREQVACCPPEDKDACCGPERAPGGCGCRAGADAERGTPAGSRR